MNLTTLLNNVPGSGWGRAVRHAPEGSAAGAELVPVPADSGCGLGVACGDGESHRLLEAAVLSTG